MALNDDSRGSIFGNRNDDSSDLSSSFDLFSKSLSRNADALKGNTKGLASSSSSLDKNTAALLEMAKSFRRSVGDFSESIDDLNSSGARLESQRSVNTQSNLADMKSIFERSNKNFDNSLTKGQKAGKILITTFEVIGKRLISEFTSAADRVASKYKDQLSNITVRMQMSNSDYSDMFNAMSARFQNEGLNKQFSPVDYADALAATIETGLRGDEAQRQAYNNLITNKLVPAISTNTIAYRRMSKQFKDSFDQNVVAVSKYTEALYGAEGLEEGKANAIYETLESRLRYEESAGNIDEGGAEKILNQIQFAVSKMEAAGINTDQFISDIGSILEGNTAESTALMQRYFGVVDTDQFAKKLSTDAFGFVEDYMRAYDAGSMTLATANEQWSALGGNLTTGMQTTTALNNYEKEGKDFFGELRDEFSGFNSSAEYAKWTQKLQQGFGQSADAAVDKLEENIATGYGVFQSEIPRFKEMASDVKAILGVLVSTLLFTKTKSALGGGRGIGSGLLNKGLGSLSTFGGGGSLTGNASAAAQMFNEGYTFSEVASVGGKGSAVLGKVGSFGGASSLGGGLANLAAGPGALIAGGALAGYQGFKSGQVAAQEGYGAGDVALQGVRGFITGGSMKTSEEKMSAVEAAMSGQKQKMDWGEVGTNALKGGLAGTGIGTAVGGWAAGAGTAIGAAVGTVAGAVTNMIDQAIENAKYNKLAEASEKMYESFDSLAQAQSNYDAVVQKSSRNQKSIDDLMSYLNGETTSSTESLNKAFKELQAQYPEYLGSLESINELEPQYLDVLRNKINLEKENAAADLATQASDALSSLEEVRKSFDNIASDEIKSTASLEFVKKIAETGGENGKVYESSEINSLLDDMIKQYGTPGMTKEDLISELNSGKSGSIIKVQEDGSLTLTGQNNKSGKGGATAGDNMAQFATDYQNSDDLRNSAISTINKEISVINQVYSSLKQIADSSKQEDGTYLFSDSTKVTAKSLADQLNDTAKEVNDHASKYKLDSMKISSDRYEGLSDIFSSLGVTPQFKVGAYNIQKDNLLSTLHKGEMVLTSANAEKLRNLGSGGISGLLDSLSAVRNARVSAVDSTSNDASLGNAIVSAIQSQTESIVSVLNSILVVVSKINPTPSRENSAVLSENLLNFSGV